MSVILGAPGQLRIGGERGSAPGCGDANVKVPEQAEQPVKPVSGVVNAEFAVGGVDARQLRCHMDDDRERGTVFGGPGCYSA